jgi:hypothetical protein
MSRQDVEVVVRWRAHCGEDQALEALGPPSYADQTASRTVARPWPTPMHSVANP